MAKKIAASVREVTGKRTKKLREEMLIPAVVFGPKRASTNLSVDSKTFKKFFTEVGYSSLADLAIEGEASTSKVLVKEVAIDPISREIIHVSFYEVDQHKELNAEIPIHFTGESAAVQKNLGFLTRLMNTLEIRCLPKNLPSEIEVDISVLSDVGNSITVADIVLPEGVEFQASMHPTMAIVTVEAPQKQILVDEAEAATGEEGDQEAPSAE